MRNKFKTLAVLGTGVLCLAALSASALPVGFAANDSDQMVVWLPGHGISSASPSASDARTVTEIDESAYTAPAILDHGTADQTAGAWGNPIVFLEPGSASLISDIVGIVHYNDPTFGQINALGFFSDAMNLSASDLATYFGGSVVAGLWVPNSGVTYVTEHLNAPTTVDITPFINSTLKGQGYTATFTSDYDPVPDGGLTAVLLGFALVGVEGLRRKLS